MDAIEQVAKDAGIQCAVDRSINNHRYYFGWRDVIVTMQWLMSGIGYCTSNDKGTEDEDVQYIMNAILGSKWKDYYLKFGWG